MRLVCPNCGAQYEVSEEAVPAEGRDVQCSACQHVWFEKGRPPPPPRLLNPQPWDELPRVEGDDEEEDDLADLRESPPPIPPARPRVDPEVSRILREEAERESQVRAEEAALRAPSDPPDVTETASDDAVERAVADLARADAAHRATAPAAEAAPLVSRQGAAPPLAEPARPRPMVEAPKPQPLREASPEPSAPPARRTQRELDVAQINATLRTQADRLGAKAPQIEGARRSGGSFGRGFWGTLLVLALLAALYVFRPEIVEMAPASAVVLDPYAEAVEAGRDWLERQVADFLGAQTAGAPAE